MSKLSKFLNFCKKHASKVLMAAGAVAVASQAQAAAVVDYSGIGTSITAEIGPALTAVVPIAGTLIAIAVGWKMVKRFTK